MDDPNTDAQKLGSEHRSSSLDHLVLQEGLETRTQCETTNSTHFDNNEILVLEDNSSVQESVDVCINLSASTENEAVEGPQSNSSCTAENLSLLELEEADGSFEAVRQDEERIFDRESQTVFISNILHDESVVEFTLENCQDKDIEENKYCLQEKSESLSSNLEITMNKISRPSSSDSDKTSNACSQPVHGDPKNSSYLPTEIENLLTSSHACSPDSDFEVSQVDFTSAPKENLMKMLSCLLDECDTLKREKARLESEVDRLEADQSSQVYTTQIESLEKALAQAQADACSWQQKLHQAEESYMTENIKIRSDLTARLERMTKEYEAANKDKESMVIKYATSEREVIVAKKQKEAIEKKMKEMEKEREQLLSKNKMLISERARICQTLDTKVQKNNWYQREVERLKEEINSRDIKIKWAQTKLKTEMDAHQESQGKLDRALTKITKHEEELKTIKEEAESIVRNTRDSENSRANILDMQLKEEKARLIMERQASESRGSAFNKVSAELEALKLKHTTLGEEATSLRKRVATYEAERDETEKLFTSLRLEVTASRQEAADLGHQLSNSAHLQQQLKREREQLAAANQEIDRLQSTNNEIESELLSCRHKEAELLAFTQKLTDKNVQIQSQFSVLQSKTQLMELEHGEIKSELDELKVQKSKLKSDLTKENQAHLSQFENLKRQLAEKTEHVKQLTTKTMELENEIQVLNKKHKNSLRDITREMQKLRKRLDNQENGTNGGNGGSAGVMLSGHSSQSATPHDSLSQGSRASSNTSLNTIEYQSTNGSSPNSQELVPLHDPLVTQQLLVDRIIKLQKSAARRSDKIEFLEEHVAHLVSELKKKSRIIHHYVMREETGALANSASDSSKSSNANIGKARRKSQAELMRHGGIMASVYGSAPRDGTMTLELSLEINRKLQAVLEDTLLKNITLKENLNTLGDEIAKISCQNQHLDSPK
ncbi:coiled-coil domain-containing protein 186 isoform X1 [Procambarus clarkii]|uniref:coiled-coil domain-containing protein 186 isoform X1 n=1 Tax=Procambarus clarkii TaxID=6728 RepID=UPI00374367E7